MIRSHNPKRSSRLLPFHRHSLAEHPAQSAYYRQPPESVAKSRTEQNAQDYRAKSDQRQDEPMNCVTLLKIHKVVDTNVPEDAHNLKEAQLKDLSTDGTGNSLTSLSFTKLARGFSESVGERLFATTVWTLFPTARLDCKDLMSWHNSSWSSM